jgi:hypothetical protein
MKTQVLILFAVSSLAAVSHAAPGVSDPDSFGRDVIYLGVAGTPPLIFKTNCALSPPPAPALCITMNAQPVMTSFAENKLATLTIPPKSTNSLLCFALTPSVNFQFHNQTGVAQPTARFVVRPTVSIENEVLNDPALINPMTGLPFNGRINLVLVTFAESRSMGANENELKQVFQSRDCIEGLLSKSALKDNYGLPAVLADDFFKHATTLTLGAMGDVQLVTNATYYFGIRLYGDAP